VGSVVAGCVGVEVVLGTMGSLCAEV